MKKAHPILMVILTIATLSFGLATNARAAWPWHRATPAASGAPVSTAPSGPLAQLNDSIHGLLSSKTTFPAFKADDMANAKAIFSDSFNRTGNLYDQAGMNCVDKITSHLQEFQLLAAPASEPTLPPLAAPVTGFASSIAAIQVTAEAKSAQVSAVNAQLAAALTLFRNGLPPDVHIACAYLAVEPDALLHMIVAHAPASAPPVK